MKTIKCTWTGIRPLVMANPQTVNVINPYAVEGRRLNSVVKAARKKADEDRLVEVEEQQRRNDFKASAYYDDEGFFLPDTVIVACLKEAAKSLKKGKDIDRAVIMEETEARIHTRAVKSLDDAFSDDGFRLETPAKIPPRTGALLWKCRCKIPSGWALSFTLTFDEQLIAAKTLAEINEIAGRMVGVGGWRPKFGRFEAEVTL